MPYHRGGLMFSTYLLLARPKLIAMSTATLGTFPTSEGDHIKAVNRRVHFGHV